MNALLLIGTLGWQELLIVLAILALLFGASRIGEMGGALGRGIREFRQEASGGKETAQPEAPVARTPAAPASSAPAEPVPADAAEQPVPVASATAETSEDSERTSAS